MFQLSHPYMTTGRTIALTIWTFAGKMICLLFITLSRFVMAFLPRSKRLLISWLQSPSTLILEPRKICHCFYFFPIYLPWNDGTGCHDISFSMLSFKPAFSFSSFTLIMRLFSSSSRFAMGVVHLHIWGCWYYSWQSRASSEECTTLHCTWREQPTTQAYFVGYSRLCHLHKDK